jgi:hypothetical protein
VTPQIESKEFESHSHLITAGSGWEEVAGYIADWLEKLRE